MSELPQNHKDKKALAKWITNNPDLEISKFADKWSEVITGYQGMYYLETSRKNLPNTKPDIPEQLVYKVYSTDRTKAVIVTIDSIKQRAVIKNIKGDFTFLPGGFDKYKKFLDEKTPWDDKCKLSPKELKEDQKYTKPYLDELLKKLKANPLAKKYQFSIHFKGTPPQLNLVSKGFHINNIDLNDMPWPLEKANIDTFIKECSNILGELK